MSQQVDPGSRIQSDRSPADGGVDLAAQVDELEVGGHGHKAHIDERSGQWGGGKSEKMGADDCPPCPPHPSPVASNDGGPICGDGCHRAGSVVGDERQTELPRGGAGGVRSTPGQGGSGKEGDGRGETAELPCGGAGGTVLVAHMSA